MSSTSLGLLQAEARGVFPTTSQAPPVVLQPGEPLWFVCQRCYQLQRATRGKLRSCPDRRALCSNLSRKGGKHLSLKLRNVCASWHVKTAVVAPPHISAQNLRQKNVNWRPQIPRPSPACVRSPADSVGAGPKLTKNVTSLALGRKMKDFNF